MKQKIWTYLLGIVVLTSTFTSEIKIVSGFSELNENYYPDSVNFKSPSNTGAEILSVRSPRGTYQEVQVYLPENYHNSSETYPVLYLSDGGSYLSSIGHMPFIIVGISFSWDERWDQYSPWVNNEMEKWFGLSSPRGGKGDEYLNYLVGLKGNIDAKYRTKPEPQHTAIGGHSMGGLFAIYAGIKRNDVFSKVIAFSPAVWFASRDINNWLENNYLIDFVSQNNPGHVSFFTYVGGKEDHHHEAPGYPQVGKFPKIYVDGAKTIQSIVGGEYIYDPDGTHSTMDFVSWFHAVVNWLEATGFGFTRIVPKEPAAAQPDPEGPQPTGDVALLIEPIVKAAPGADGSVVHLVQYGQTLWTIAEIYGVQLSDLLNLNNLTEESTLFLNQELVIEPARVVDEDVSATTTANAEQHPTKTPAPTSTRTPFPTPTKTLVSTPTNILPAEVEEVETSGISGLIFLGEHSILWMGIGLILTSLVFLAFVFYPSFRKGK